jgi:predicted DNA-binding transcriptional regulator AlpA
MPQAIQVEPDGLNRAQRRAKESDQRHIRPRFVSIPEAADYLGCSRSTFYARFLPEAKTIRIGARRLVDFDWLEAVADQLLLAEE